MPTPKSVSPLLKVVVRAYVLGELDRDKPRVRAAVVAGRKLLSVHHSHFVFSGVFFVMVQRDRRQKLRPRLRV